MCKDMKRTLIKDCCSMGAVPKLRTLDVVQQFGRIAWLPEEVSGLHGVFRASCNHQSPNTMPDSTERAEDLQRSLVAKDPTPCMHRVRESKARVKCPSFP